jgi:hypothetical protein
MEQRALKNVSNCWNTNIFSYLETSGGQSSNLYLNVVHFPTPVLIRQLWQLKTVIFLHWCLMRAVPLRLQSVTPLLKRKTVYNGPPH